MWTEPAALRQRIRSLRDALPEDVRAAASRRICERLCALPEVTACQRLFAYAPLGSEVSIEPLLQAFLDQGKTVALPRVTGPGTMDFHILPSLEALQSGAYGIREPRADWDKLPPQAAQLILVPGLVFSPRGDRIGYGGGFYDRYLPQCRALTVMPAFACQQADFQARPHDVGMNLIVTQDQTIRCTQEV